MGTRMQGESSLIQFECESEEYYILAGYFPIVRNFSFKASSLLISQLKPQGVSYYKHFHSKMKFSL